MRPDTAPIHLNDSQEALIKQWAVDDRLWTTQETVEFNLHIFVRAILKTVCAGESMREQALRDIKAVHTRFYRGEMTAENAADEMEAIAVSVWQRES